MSSSFEINKYLVIDNDEKVNSIILVKYKM